MEEQESSQQSKWNFDGAELYIIFQYKTQFLEFLDVWDLENAYWKLRRMRGELDAKLKREHNKLLDSMEEEKEKKVKVTEKQLADEKLEELTVIREQYKIDNNKNNLELKNKFYIALEEFYLFLCFLMKKHGLYFREGEDSTFAVLRR